MASAVVDLSNPLLIAARSGRLAHAQRLLEGGADPDVHTAAGWTPLHSAAFNGHLAIVKLLIQHHAFLEREFESKTENEISKRTPLQQACLRNYPEVVEALLDAGANIEAGPPSYSPPLVFAAGKGHIAVMKVLLDRRPNINASKENGWTALHAASFNGHALVVRLLAQHGADIAALYENTRTPLHKAAEVGHVEVAAALLEAGADVNERTNEGFTPLFLAAREGKEAVAKLLLERGCRVDAHSINGRMPLHIAATNGHHPLVELLLLNGAPMEAKLDGAALTALHHAASEGFANIVHTLLNYGANIEATSRDGSTPLHLAAANGHWKVVKLLLDRHANCKARNNDKKTPLTLADENHHAQVSSLLLSAEEDGDYDVSELMSNLSASGDAGTGHPDASALAGGTQGADAWLRRIDELNRLIASIPKPKDVNPIRIAVLDTGCSPDGSYFSYPGQRQRIQKEHWRDFAGSSLKPIDQDLNKHGTMVSSLLLRTARNAEIFIARIAKAAPELGIAAENVKKAIEHAQNPEGWNVDIVCMSFGFREAIPSIERAIFDAQLRESRPVLFFAAAANNGSNERELFPAYLHEVISVRGTDSLGSFVGAYDPPPMRMNEGLPLCGTLGQNVPYALGESGSGCSVATPIMAGMVAMIMQWVGYKTGDKAARRKLCTTAGIRELLKAEAVKRGNDRYYFHVWDLFANNGARCVGVVEGVMSGLP
ncbi:hypothetical protein DL766_000358 [Monosporascus sp. MC13-8B]|nr:hypothetical protein DL763_001113 [Monosporascus cannonballus]RYP39536.1 hypothetical protein DL766_000358 [Monosporascus sp. MC13-8B]